MPIRPGVQFVICCFTAMLTTSWLSAQPEIREAKLDVNNKRIPDKAVWIATASALQSEDHGAALAIDGNQATRWGSPAADGQWLQIDLGRPATASGIQLRWETARASKYRLLVSDDGQDWQTCLRVDEGHGLWDRFYFPPTSGRYWRLVCDERASEWGNSIWEIEVLDDESRPMVSTGRALERRTDAIMDGNRDTVWVGSRQPQETIFIDLRERLEISGVCVYWGNSFANGLQLETSNNRQDWQPVKGEYHREAGEFSLILGPKLNTRFLRLRLTDANDSALPISIREVELRGAEEAVRYSSLCRCHDNVVEKQRKGGADDFDLTAKGLDRRVDLRWRQGSHLNIRGYNIFRAAVPEGPYKQLNLTPYPLPIYSDFHGRNEQTYFYRVTSVNAKDIESSPSRTVSARSTEMADEQLLNSIQEAAFRYFWNYVDPTSGLAREGFITSHPCETCTTGGTGFGMMTLMVGAERGYAPREQIAKRLRDTVRFLEEKATRYHGVWPHWLNGESGETIPFATAADNGGDLVETAFLVQGMLTVRHYFDRDNPVETELRDRITRLWEQVEWDWYLREPGNKRLYWHWSPDHHWKMNHQVSGFNECLIAYLLAMASPTHSIPTECYDDGWIGSPEQYASGEDCYGIKLLVGDPKGAPLFFTHYSFLGLDPHKFNDRFGNYFDINRNTTLINHAYCVANPGGHKGYGKTQWGLTASMNPDGYKAHAPSLTHDDGTISPTAVICALPYTPDKSMNTIRHLYRTLGHRLWGPFGFYDAFNLDRDWVSDTYLAIDQGPMAPMIENYRSGLCWKMFMSNPEFEPILDSLRTGNTNAADN